MNSLCDFNSQRSRSLKPGTIFFFHHARWSPVGVLLVLTEREQEHSAKRWLFRQLDTGANCYAVYVDDGRDDITIVGQLPPGELDATVFKGSYHVPPARPILSQRSGWVMRFLKRIW